MRIAPDKDDPFPLPQGNGGGGNGGGKPVGFMPGEISGLAHDMVNSAGGTVDKWKKYLHKVYKPSNPPDYLYGGGKGKGKGGKDKGGTKDGVTYQGDTNVHPPMRMTAPAGYGVMTGVQPGAGVLSGIPMMPQQQQMASPQMQMPDAGVLAMLRARMGGQ